MQSCLYLTMIIEIKDILFIDHHFLRKFQDNLLSFLINYRLAIVGKKIPLKNIF